MTKWLGRESSNRVKCLRLVHVTNPVISLKKTWELSSNIVRHLKCSSFFPKSFRKRTLKAMGIYRLAKEITVCQRRWLPPSPVLPGYCTWHWTHSCPMGMGFKEKGSLLAWRTKKKMEIPQFEIFTRFAHLSSLKTPSLKGTRNLISVHKTDVFSISSSVRDPNKSSTIREKPHHLTWSKAFSVKCCGSNTHLAKDCANL